MSRSLYRLPALLGVIHAIVDGSSAMVVLSSVHMHGLPWSESFNLVVAYNLLAFGSQPLFGMAVDKLRAPKASILVGLLVMAVAVLAARWDPIATIVLAGIGNALFHVGGGSISLSIDPRRSTPPGVFVAPGALGLALGIWLGYEELLLVWPALAVLALSFLVTLFLPVPEASAGTAPASSASPEATSTPTPPAIRHPTLLVALLLLSIGARALVGYAGCYACPKVAMMMAALALAAFGGKAVGGIVSDRLGWLETSVVALLLSAPFIAFGNGNLFVIVAGLFLFQVTMPVTVSAIALVYPGRPGFAFGLSAAAFIIGAVATFFAPVKALYGAWVFFVLILISAGAVYWGLRLLGDENPCRGFLTRAQGAVVERASGPWSCG